jgi:Phosphodiester glycosidase
MRKFTVRRGAARSIALAFALALSLADGALLPAAGSPDVRKAERVAPGVEHIEIRRGEFGRGLGPDRWVVNVLVCDPAKVRLGLGRARDRGVGTETTSAIARRRGAIAATNGGYFRTDGPYRGEPAGIVVRGGKVLSEPSHGRPGLAVASRGARTRLTVVDVVLRAEAVVSAQVRRRIDGINRPRLDDELILFTPEFDRTTLTGPQGIEATVIRGRVTGAAGEAGSAVIPRQGYVLSAHGQAAAWVRTHLKPGTKVETRTEVTYDPKPVFVPDFVLGGGPRLIRGGKVAPPPDPGIYSPGFADARHPRTAVGVRADGRVLLVTVDGRQPEISVGMTIAELAGLLRELGAVEAINMDGGGSTTMVVGGKVVNSPSDLTGERPVGDALLVLSR